jgi:aminoglycoside phosphotransferase
VRWGDELTVKIPHHDEESVAACLGHARVSTAVRLLGVRAPEIVAVEDLRPLVAVPVIVSRFLPGHRLSPGDPAPGVWAAVGAQLAHLHAATPAEAPPGLRTFTQSRDVDPGVMTEQLLSSGRVSMDVAGRLARLDEQLVVRVLPDDRPVLCHGDVHAENVIALDGRYVGLVDFAGAGWLDAAWDFVGVPPAAVASLVAGYGDAGGRHDSLVERMVWCRLQTALLRLAGSRRPEDDARRAAAEAELLLA